MSDAAASSQSPAPSDATRPSTGGALRPVIRWLHRPVVLALVGSLLVAGVIIGLRERGHLLGLEFWAYDTFLSSAAPRGAAQQRVVVIGLTEEDVTSGSAKFPITDRQLVKLLKRLLADEPRAIGVDIVRDHASADEEPPQALPAQGATVPSTEPAHELSGRAQLQALWNSDQRIVIGMLLSPSDGGLLGVPEGLPREQAGLANFPMDEDGVVRRGYLALGSPKVGTYPSMPSLLAQFYLAQEQPPIYLQPEPPDHPDSPDLRLGHTLFKHLQPSSGEYVHADTGGIQYLLDYHGRSHIPHFSLQDVMSGKVRPEDVRGSVVLVGYTMKLVKDQLDTPLPERVQFGVDVQAWAVDQLLRSAIDGATPMRYWPDRMEYVWILVWTVAGGFAGLMLRSPWRLALLLGAGAAALMLVGRVVFAFGGWIPVMPPVLGWLAAAFVVTSYVSYLERSDRRVVMRMLSAHVSDGVAQALWDQRDQFLEDGRVATKSLIATVLFSDLQGFSTISEGLTPEELLRWLNETMEGMAEAVTQHGGMVNKYIGDAVMAIFGVPVASTTRAEQSRDAQNAVRCALAMRAGLDRLNEGFTARGLPTIRMRIGVFTGKLVAGSLGGKRRQEYTVIGDTVNTASRLESFDKELMDDDIAACGCRILIGQPTCELLDGAAQTRYIGELSLKGKVEKVAVHGVIGEAISPPKGKQGVADDDPVQGDRPLVSARS